MREALLQAPPRPRVRPIRRAPVPTAGTGLDERCAVEALKVEAAQTIRLIRELRSRPEILGEAEADRAPVAEIIATLRARLRTIEDLATHRRGASVAGAIFQLCLAASDASELASEAVFEGPGAHAMRGKTADVGRLHYNAIATMIALYPDPDLSLLAEHYLPPAWDVAGTCDALLKARRHGPPSPERTGDLTRAR